MNKDKLLKRARAEEFWNKHFESTTQLRASSFFGGINLKNEDSVTTEKVYLDPSDVEKVVKLCAGSEYLVYNFYLSALSILLTHYQEEPLFISPVDQFGALEAEEGFFFAHPKINKGESFKNLFVSQKQLFLQATENVLKWELIDGLLGKTGIVDRVAQFGLVVGGEATAEIQGIVKTLFVFQLKGNQPYFEITVRREMFAPDLLGLFGNNFVTLLHEIIEKIYEPISELSAQGTLEANLLEDINTVQEYFPLTGTVVDLIDSQAR